MVCRGGQAAFDGRYVSSGLIDRYRRQASSHKFNTGFKGCGVPVGAGLPAMGCKAAPNSPRYHRKKLTDPLGQPPPNLSVLPHTTLPTRAQSSRRVSTMNTPSKPKHSSEPISSA
ncbi:hypothetical protein D0894_01725 [Pseudomonas monteilii]|uniref:Uncharacterized protein n=1 Tax=Pseudomonas monteilii TaxID=76759 RepID=A0A399MEP1_9PSED|nr:hypothetical protein D0894_01725 [Pseudomonas monteilii]